MIIIILIIPMYDLYIMQIDLPLPIIFTEGSLYQPIIKKTTKA